MSDYKRKRGRDEPTGNGSSCDPCCTNYFGVEVRHGLPKIRNRKGCRVPFSDKDRHNFTGADIQETNPVGRHMIEDGIDLGRPFFRYIPFSQSTRVQVEGIRHAYSSRMAMMPWLNSLDSGLNPFLSNRSRSFLAPIGLLLMPSCFMNFFQPAMKSASSSRETRKSSSPSARSSRSASEIGFLC